VATVSAALSKPLFAREPITTSVQPIEDRIRTLTDLEDVYTYMLNLIEKCEKGESIMYVIKQKGEISSKRDDVCGLRAQLEGRERPGASEPQPQPGSDLENQVLAYKTEILSLRDAISQLELRLAASQRTRTRSNADVYHQVHYTEGLEMTLTDYI
jgi:hypothetical protein